MSRDDQDYAAAGDNAMQEENGKSTLGLSHQAEEKEGVKAKKELS